MYFFKKTANQNILINFVRYFSICLFVSACNINKETDNDHSQTPKCDSEIGVMEKDCEIQNVNFPKCDSKIKLEFNANNQISLHSVMSEIANIVGAHPGITLDNINKCLDSEYNLNCENNLCTLIRKE